MKWMQVGLGRRLHQRRAAVTLEWRRKHVLVHDRGALVLTPGCRTQCQPTVSKHSAAVDTGSGSSAGLEIELVISLCAKNVKLQLPNCDQFRVIRHNQAVVRLSAGAGQRRPGRVAGGRVLHWCGVARRRRREGCLRAGWQSSRKAHPRTQRLRRWTAPQGRSRRRGLLRAWRRGKRKPARRPQPALRQN